MGNNARGQWEVASDAEDPAYVAGNWYMTTAEGAPVAGVILPLILRLHPFRIRQFVNIAQLGARITTLAAAGNIQLAVYPANGNNLLPTGQPIARTGNIATDTAGNVAGSLVGGNAQLPRGIYWFGALPDATAAGVVIMQILGQSTSFGALIGGPQSAISQSATAATFVYTVTGVTVAFGSWPDLTGSSVITQLGSTNAWALGQFQVQA